MVVQDSSENVREISLVHWQDVEMGVVHATSASPALANAVFKEGRWSPLAFDSLAEHFDKTHELVSVARGGLSQACEMALRNDQDMARGDRGDAGDRHEMPGLSDASVVEPTG